MADTRCAVCKHKGISCPEDCFYYPFFAPHNPNAVEDFTDVNSYYGTNKFKALIQAAAGDDDYVRQKITSDSLKFEAHARRHDPVLGLTGIVKLLYVRLRQAEHRLTKRELITTTTTITRLHNIGETSDANVQKQVSDQCVNAYNTILANPSKFAEKLGFVKEVDMLPQEVEDFVQSVLQEPDDQKRKRVD